MEDTNGNQVKINYMTARGSSWANSSARISTIEDVRAVNNGYGVYNTYQFTYNQDNPPHLTSITNSIQSGESYTFSYNYNEPLQDPFVNYGRGSTTFLSQVTLPVNASYQFTTNSYGEITQITLPYNGYLAYNYATVTYGNFKSFRQVQSRSLYDGINSPTTYSFTHESVPGYDVHVFTALEDPGGSGEKYWAFNATGTYEGLAST